VLKAAAVLYMLPLVLFFGGYALGAAYGLGAVTGGLAFALSILLIVLYDRRMQKEDNTVYTITDYAGDTLLKTKKKGDNDRG
jgi:sigma-E factor negative regulatory protein RseC